ncbi:Hypp4181 [Branchiostoma lanceolatum]|uniref:Hypp4181 protein n=1 Tax=Branchiostoma lanceolatum TaxID=7740 RepID=A0A8K0A7W4_BRALA|nr:Hypp4181 [Branchiostoma lanceolatum]
MISQKLFTRYYKGDKSVSAFTGSQITHKTLLLDRGLLTLWNDTMAAKGFSSDKDFLWFLLLRPQKSCTNSKVYTVRDDVASDKDGVEKNIASDDNHIPSTWGAVNIKVEKEDGPENDFGNFDSTNSSFPQLGLNIKEEDKVLYSSCDKTSSSQLSHDTVSIKVEKEDELEMDLGSHDNTNASSDIQEEELEMHLNMAIMATAEHLD